MSTNVHGHRTWGKNSHVSEKVGNAATVCYKKLASLLYSKRDQPYCNTIAWIRCSLSFSLLRSSIQCIRGARSAGGRASNQFVPPIDLVSAEAKISSSL